MNRRPPAFLLPENRRDSKGRRPDEADYNPCTLQITRDDYAKLPDGMKRYWDIKSKNMDKIIFWRFGDWYVVYYDDLTICARLGLDLAITPFPSTP